MSTLTLPQQRIFFMSDGFGIEPKIYAGSRGAKVYSGVAVFRSGTFRDSMGIQNTWEDLHIKQMVDNNTYLRNNGILQSVPARDGHKSYLVGDIPGRGEVVGWHRDLEAKTLKSPVDGSEYTYLLADYEITQPYALEKIENGTWRNRSAEIGGYSTNAESEFWPVYLGFAYVDFSAVEGLNFSSSQGTRFYVHFGGNTRETQVSEGTQAGQPGITPPLPFPANVLPPQTAPTQHAAPTQPQTPVQAPAAFVFSIGGQNVTDPVAVQSYINRVETWAREVRETSRKDFVAGLVASNKITAPQAAGENGQPGMEAFALSLSDEQYAQWTSMWSVAPTQPILANHGGGVSNPTNNAQAGSVQDPEAQKLADAEAIVQMHERGRTMEPDKLKQTGSYKLLVKHGKREA